MIIDTLLSSYVWKAIVVSSSRTYYSGTSKSDYKDQNTSNPDLSPKEKDVINLTIDKQRFNLVLKLVFERFLVLRVHPNLTYSEIIYVF